MNIFICQTPFQLFYAFQLIRNFGKTKYCIIHSNLDLSNYEIDSDALLISTKDRNLSLIGSIVNYHSIFDQIRNFNKDESQVSFFIPHRGGLIANYIYHNKKFLNVNFYYEGVLYFYDYSEPYNKHHVQRAILGLTIGFRYKYDKVIYPYLEERVKRIYTPIAELTKGDKEKLVEVKFKISNITENTSRAYLILGGAVPYIKSLYEYAIETILKEDESAKIYYKGHASFLTHDKNYRDEFLKVSKKYNITFEELNILEPVEVSLTKVNVTHVFSYFSSALVNFNLIRNNGIKILCYNGEELNDDLKEVINHFKIEIKNV